MNNIEEDNIGRLRRYIESFQGLIAETERQIAEGDGWLDAQLVSLKHRLNDFCEQLVEAEKQGIGDEDVSPLGQKRRKHSAIERIEFICVRPGTLSEDLDVAFEESDSKCHSILIDIDDIHCSKVKKVRISLKPREKESLKFVEGREFEPTFSLAKKNATYEKCSGDWQSLKIDKSFARFGAAK